jgi:alkylation response protein AidB-like acyl-CoA dehydrogenase
VNDLLEVIAAGAEEADRRARLADTTVDALRRAEVFAARLPGDLGGPGTGLVAQFDLVDMLARVDGSAAWNATFMATAAAWPAARLPDAGIAEVLGGRPDWPLFAGTFVPSGEARPVPGGYRVRGRWGFASGIHHAEWVVAGCVRADVNELVWCVLRTCEVTVHDTWDSVGLRGTGSCDYSVDDVLVPVSRTFHVTGEPWRGGPLHRLPMHAFLTPDHTAVTLGCARRALDEAATGAIGKLRLGSGTPLADRGAFRRDLGRADTRLRAAYALVRHVLAVLDATSEAPPDLVLDATSEAPPDLVLDATSETRPDLVLEARVAATHAAEVAVEVATFAYRAGGAHATIRSSPLGRAYRDAMTSSQHVHVIDDVYEKRAEVMLARPRPPVP